MLLTFILLSLILSALFSGTEIAFISANKLIVELKKKKGSRRGTVIAKFYENPSEFIGTLLVGNNIALVAFTTLMTIPLNALFKDNLGIENDGVLLLLNTLIITGIMLIFGEFLPKTIFRLYSDSILYFLAFPLKMVKFWLAIPAKLMTNLSNFLLRYIFKIPIDAREDPLTRLDLENFIRTTQTEMKDDIDTELFEKALNLREVKVRECMIPRPEIETIEVHAGIEELIRLFKDTNHSRIIVYKEDIDNVMGYLHHQQMLDEPKSFRKLILKMPFVPEAMRVRDLLNHFIKKGVSIACVLDEFGGTAGIITLEDILEEIFGEIEDEHDKGEYVEKKISEKEYIFSGRLEIDYLNEKYPNLQFPEGEYHTLSGYLVMTTEKIPKKGAEIEMDGYKFFLEKVSETKIETIRVIKLSEIDH